MQLAGFELWDIVRYPERERWEEHIRQTLPAELANRTLLVSPPLEVLRLYQRKGFAASPDLTSRLSALIEIEGALFAQRVDEMSDLLIRELNVFMGGTMPAPKIPQVISPLAVLDYVKEHNPFFSRWLLFQSEQSRRSPSEWEEYASVGLNEEDAEYAKTMREFAQTLQDLISAGRMMTEFIGIGLMHSHELSGEERYWNTVTWLYTAQQDAIR